MRRTIEPSIAKVVRLFGLKSRRAMRRPSALPQITPTRLSLLQRITGFGDAGA
ncbi:hypothetical protein [Piscinibacter sp.]|uniref:hypothetical protein n=1 Tax=Piscinibacter sp. TaxID=1903157 RepID=UPI002CE8A058|nr:hypothetical protein [Albitalea sp.]HUG20995.1 hypothetical protein [Albitalea sp.]